MAKITAGNNVQTQQPNRAIHFEVGNVLVHVSGLLGIRTEEHIVRQSGADPSSLFVLSLPDSRDMFTLAPAGTSFTITAE